MGTLINLLASKYGRLTVLERAGKDKHGKATWNCLCECGENKVVRGVDVVSGHTLSCGCLRRAGADAALSGLYRDYSRRALKRELKFSLTKKEFEKITQMNCHYCGVAPFNKTKWTYADIFVYNGIDRTNNDEGYISGNVVPCCKYCNYLKGSMNIKMFLHQIEKINNFAVKRISAPAQKHLRKRVYYT